MPEPTYTLSDDDECGCVVRFQAVDYDIDFCPLHAAAQEMLETLKDTEMFLMGKARRDPQERELVDSIGDVIRKAAADA